MVAASQRVQELTDRKLELEAELALIDSGLLDTDQGRVAARLAATIDDITAADIALHKAKVAAEAVQIHHTEPGAVDLTALSDEELRQHIDDRIHSEEFTQLLATRDAARERREATAATFAATQSATAGDDDPAALQQLAQARADAYDAHCAYLEANAPVEEYKDITAQAALELGKRDPVPEWTGDTLGSCHKLGDFEEGSREWLEARQQWIGGSDVGAILGVDPHRTTTDIKNSKLTAITDADVEAQALSISSATGPLGRGHAWEPVIVRQFAADNPDVTVMTAKATWHNPDIPYQGVNVDSVLSSDGGQTIDGFLECKTGSDAAAWADGPPAEYRAQLAQYLHTAGLKYGVIAARIDDRETRYYRIGVDDPLDASGKTIADHQEKLASTWQRWETERENPAGPRPNKSTFGWVKNPGSASSMEKNASTARDLAAYRGISQERAASLIQDAVYAGKSPDQAVRDLYGSYDPTTNPDRRYVTVDFETNSRSASKGQIIQTGVVVTDGQGKVVERIDSLHGIDQRIRDSQGTGATSVHGITPEMVDNRTPFHTSAQYKRLATLLSDPNTTLVAHNAQFEKTWLRAHGIGTPRVIDTMRLRQRFDHGTVGSTNQDFCQANGVEYVNAHNAATDADMTSRALHSFMRRLFQTPKGF
ncbi:YqaJ viral recombinase family protein [Dietzia sp. 179-F 9C3 NHS]|uniref:YqaJ viral recombinase family protein n=1 Tax=Dietzia sp. 179-F 9C3 NHS TaxID=3374295 RepID=UPI003879BBDF